MDLSMVFFVTITLLTVYGFALGMVGLSWLLTKKQTLQNTYKEKITVLVPARNEEKNIVDCLKSILNQTYPNYEVIVINDHSNDKTEELVNQIVDLYPNKVQLINLTERHGKKAAITAGIKKSTNEIIITTDADCLYGINWLKALHSTYITNKSKMVIGPVSIVNLPGVLSAFQQIEQLGLMIISAGGVYLKKPILCSGANLLYEKTAFREVDGFNGIDIIPTGDDVLLMKKFEQHFGSKSIAFAKSKQAVVNTVPLSNVKNVIQQKTRWASKIKTNPHFFTLILSIIAALTNLLMVAYALFTVLKPQLVEKLLLLFAFKVVIDILFLSLATSFFGKTKLLLLALPLQVVVPFYTVFIGITSLTGNYKWKGRSYHHGKKG